ncbi:tyrosine-type recombinase/integrase [Halocatena pleomorpha]|uniref:tyrosine-type recombinase/integrase n=1 Tax=Halocatena pleomorpha TaxID=1785090 RepID=UPI001F159F95|nr:site-specific integrase [Halocatena pleomorpha]
MNLEPIDPETALDLYLADRETEVSQATLYSHSSHLGHFLRWCDQEHIENLNDLSGRQLHLYRLWRRNEGDLRPVSEKTQMDTLRVFIRWLESIEGVERDLSTKVQSPSIAPTESARDVMLDDEHAESVLTYLEKYEYATLAHVSIALVWHTMMRIGAVHALDVDDYHSDDQYVVVSHRPETGMPIKNKERGERMVALSDQIYELLDDWIADRRPSVCDDHGRQPLLATPNGGVCKSVLRYYVYQWTRPCTHGEPCPHDRDSSECPATDRDHASSCPSSVSPHVIQRGSITHYLHRDMPARVVSDRANVS